MSNINFKKLWLGFYGIGLVLIPPIHFHDKFYFAAEWMAVPMVFLFFFKFLKERESPPKTLIFVWIAATVAFMGGMFRGDLASQITQYPLISSQFSLGSDGITYLRWLIILSTPWGIKYVFRGQDYLKYFFKVLTTAFLISGSLSILDHFQVISLENWGYFKSTTENWVGRSYGTFISPNEAGLMYGIFAVYMITAEEFLFTSLNLISLGVTLAALALTHCGTAFTAAVITIFAFTALTEGRGWKVYSILGALILVGYLYTQKFGNQFIYHKIVDLSARQTTWRNWIQVAPQNLRILLYGIGFSKLVVDNSLILLLIQGGFIFLVAVLKYIKELMSQIPAHMKFVFFFWGMSWLTLDSITYWGVGRLCWLLLGLFLAVPTSEPKKG